MPPTCELCSYHGDMLALYPAKYIVRCPACSLVFYHPHDQHHSHYGPDYFAGAEYLDYLADKSVLQRNFRKRIATLRKYSHGGRLLEIGSAYGFFLELARQHWLVKGIDIAPHAVHYAQGNLGLDALCADFLQITDRQQSCDVICLWDTLEHLPHPVQVIKKAARWLKPAGILALTTADIASLTARFRGRRWRQIHPPTHLFYFSSQTLRRTLCEAGLELLHLSHVGCWRSYASIIHGLLGLNPSFLHQLLTLRRKLNFPVYLNLFDIMLVIARKPPPQRSHML